MRNFLIPSLLLFTGSLFGQDMTTRIDNYLSRPARKKALNGTVLIVHHGNTLLFKGYGYRNAATKTLNDTATVYRIGSLSKPFTAAIILRLAEQHELSVTDTIGKFLTGYRYGSLVTIEHLLTHSSGIKEYLQIKEIQQMPDSAPPIAMQKLISYFCNEPLVIRPGEKFTYSNSNYILLAAIIERITGKKFEQVVRHDLLEPLAMLHSGFDFKHLADTNKSTGHFNAAMARTIPEDFDSTLAPGSGSMYATAMDLYRWYQGLYNGKVFTDSTREKAFTARKSDYGYGWFNEKKKRRTCISHAGGVPGFVANLQFYPGEDLCVIILSNDIQRDIFTDSDRIGEMVLRNK